MALKAWRVVIAVLGVAVTFLVFSNPDRIYDITNLLNFQARDMARAIRLLNGELIFFGPEMTGGGALPGPFYYFLLLPSVLVSKSWVVTWCWLLLLNILAATVVFRFIKEHYSPTSALAWLIFFPFSLQTKRFISMFLNVSFAIPLVLLITVFLTQAYALDDRRRRERHLTWAAVMLGLGLQLHFSLIVFLFAFLVLQILAPRLAFTRHSGGAILRAALGLIAPLTPFFIWKLCRAFGFEFGQEPFYSGQATKSLTSLLHMLDYVFTKSLSQVILELLQRLTEVLPLAIFAMIGARIWESRSSKAKELPQPKVTWPLMIVAASGFIPFLYWIFATIGMRYGSAFTMTALVISAAFYGEVAKSSRRSRIYVCFTLVGAGLVIYALAREVPEFLLKGEIWLRLGVCLIVGIAAGYILNGLKFPSRVQAAMILATVLLSFFQSELGRTAIVRPEPLLAARVKHWTNIWRQVITRTGWDYNTAIHRTYFINHHLEQDPRPVFEQVKSALGRISLPGNPPDGYFVAFFQSTIGMSMDDVRSWLLSRRLQKDVREALLAGDIVLDPFAPAESLVVPFRVVKENLVPRHFHSYGKGYEIGNDERALAAVVDTEGALKQGTNQFLFKWNECVDRHPYCDTGTIVRIEAEEKGVIRIRVRVVGMSLSQVSPWISPNWTMHWVNPYVEVTCGGKAERRLLLSSIGYNRDYAADPGYLLLWGNNSVVAPFEREFRIDCTGPVTKLAAGRKSAVVERIYDLEQLPTKHLSVDLTAK